MLPVGFCLADLPAFKRVVVVGEDETTPLCKPVLVIQQPLQAAIAGLGIDGHRFERGEENKIGELAFVGDERTNVREEVLQGPMHRRDGFRSFALCEADIVEGQYPAVVQQGA